MLIASGQNQKSVEPNPSKVTVIIAQGDAKRQKFFVPRFCPLEIDIRAASKDDEFRALKTGPTRLGMMMKFRTLILLTILQMMTVAVCAQTAEFTYQGSLKDGSFTANGTYDFEFRLFDQVSAGAQQGGTIQRPAVTVANGIFTVPLDFGTGIFPGADRFLEIAVRPVGGGAFTALNPRQKINSVPYSVKSLNSTNADTATNATQLGGVAAGQFVVTTDPRMTDSRSPTAGSTNYIQNQDAVPQASSNFRISGTGTANFINATTQFNLNNTRILSNAGTENLFVGVGTGQVNTGSFNSFFGHGAGQANTTANGNTFLGRAAGIVNTTGNENSFVGQNAGLSNTTGNGNSFFGVAAGQSNTTADANSFFGYAAGVSNTTGSVNSFFGFDAGRFNTTGSTNSFFGQRAGWKNTTGSQNSFFGWTAGQENTAENNSFFGYASGQRNTTGTFNSFFGHAAGLFNTTGNSNSFFGQGAGQTNTVGTLNTFIGQGAGFANTGGSNNAFVGQAAGYNNTSGAGNAFFGRGSGFANTDGSNNTFVGLNAGSANTSASNNTFVGTGAGQTNTSGNSNSFVGVFAGFFNTSGLDNSFFGRSAGQDNTIGSNNAFFGRSAGEKNTEGIENSFVGSLAGFNNTFGSFNSFVGRSAGQGNTTGNENSFFGTNAGLSNSTGGANSFVGSGAGRNNTTAFENSFFGRDAGRDTQTGGANAFVGVSAGQSNTTGVNNSFFGRGAGSANITGSNNTAIGRNANVFGSNLSFATAIGADSTVSNSNTIVLGRNSGVDTVVIPGTLVADLPSGDVKYIHNGATPQSASFSVTGNGYVGLNLGVGTTNPSTKLAVQTSGAGFGITHSNATTSIATYVDSNEASIGTRTFHRLGFYTNNSGSQMTLATNGNLGIGTNNPQLKLDVVTPTNNFGFSHNDGTTRIASYVGPGSYGVRGGWIGTTTFDHLHLFANNGTPSISIAPSGEVTIFRYLMLGNYIRITEANNGFDEVCTNGLYELASCSSSLRYKTNVEDFSAGMSFVNRLRPISYDWKDGGRKDTGFGAEEVEKIDPRFVTYNKEGQVEGVKYNRLSVVFVNALKEQQAQIERQQKQIEALTRLICLQSPEAEICREEKK